MSLPKFQLTAQERFLLSFYRTVPEETRQRVGGLLFDSWTHPPEKEIATVRWNRAFRQLRLGNLSTSLIDKVKSGMR